MDQGSLRLDHQLSARDSVFGRLSIYRVNTFQPFGTTQLNESLLPGFGRELDTNTGNVALSHTHTFSANVLNELRFGWLGTSQPAEKGPSSFDHRHRFVAGYVYELPLRKGAAGARDKLVAGWQVSGIVTVQSGAPFTVNLGVDRANIGSGPAQRPDLLRDPNLSSGQTPVRWFDTSAFALPAPFTFGNARRNIVLGPGYSDVDFSIQQDTRINETVKLKFRAEAFNLFNHPNFDTPNRIAFTPSFGRIFSAEPSRQIQLALKMEV
jgi:hypothetical protein